MCMHQNFGASYNICCSFWDFIPHSCCRGTGVQVEWVGQGSGAGVLGKRRGPSAAFTRALADLGPSILLHNSLTG